ncbi:hypothetical protein [Pseudomonas chlororaphis]|uniref:hypothetical protein n=1 Tax=Pseudomonas chlororaphis TaxID=587753 RepID=UPI002D79469E|nr:hypothetical protein [Pseudomonas chlororaphis]
MNASEQQSREDDLLLARQFGQVFVRELNQPRIRADFDRLFKGDREALEQFEFGVVEEDQKRLTMGLSRTEFHAYHVKKGTAHGHGRV